MLRFFLVLLVVVTGFFVSAVTTVIVVVVIHFVVVLEGVAVVTVWDRDLGRPGDRGNGGRAGEGGIRRGPRQCRIGRIVSGGSAGGDGRTGDEQQRPDESGDRKSSLQHGCLLGSEVTTMPEPRLGRPPLSV